MTDKLLEEMLVILSGSNEGCIGISEEDVEVEEIDNEILNDLISGCSICGDGGNNSY